MDEHVKQLGVVAGVGTALGVGLALGMGLRIVAMGALVGLGVGAVLGLATYRKDRRPYVATPLTGYAPAALH
jgi:hypothetical protein